MKYVLFGVALAVMAAPVTADTDVATRPPEKITTSTQPKGELTAPSHTQITSDVQGSDEMSGTYVTGTTLQLPKEAQAQIPKFETTLRPPARVGQIPRTRWQHMQGHQMWTRAALSALKSHGQPLVDLVPADIETWCPAYATGSDQNRRAFWVGFMSALAKYESTYKPWAVGGGGKWYGLLQILPGTARGYKCNVGTGEALKNGAANLSCAVRIMAYTVPRDGVIHGYKGGRGRGVTADWGPMHSKAKRSDMARWLRRQTYCKPIGATRPKSRP